MRLELTRRADYAIRATVCLARSGSEWMTGRSIAVAGEIPARFAAHVLGDLVRADLVEARIGRTGGYRLLLPAEEINLLAIVEAVEGNVRRRRCVLQGGECRPATGCEVHDVFASAQEALIARLATATLGETAGVQR